MIVNLFKSFIAICLAIVLFNLEGWTQATTSAENQTAEKKTEEEVADLKKEAEASAPIIDFFKKTTVSGYVDAYVGYSSNTPANGIVELRGLDTRHNSLQFDLAKISFDGSPSEVGDVGYVVDLVYGPAADSYHSFEPVAGQQEIIKNIQQGYVSYVAPVGEGLTVYVGKFGTFVGGEVLDTIDNYQYQQSILFGFAQPYYHTGMSASYDVSENVSWGLYLVNGWNNSTDNNTGKSFGWSVSVSPNEMVSITQGYLGGPELTGLNSPWRHLLDTVIGISVNDQVELLFNYDYGFDAEDLPTYTKTTWNGIAGAVRFKSLDGKWAFSPRFEIFSDGDAFATGTKQTLKEITLTADYRAIENFSTKIEYRVDRSDKPFFNGKTSQSVFLIGWVYRFGFGEK